MFGKKNDNIDDGDEYVELLDPLGQTPRERLESIRSGRRAYWEDKSLEAAHHAIAEGGVARLHEVIVDELKRSYQGMLSGPFVRTAYDGSVEVFAPDGALLVKVDRDQAVTVKPRKAPVDVVIESEAQAEVKVRCALPGESEGALSDVRSQRDVYSLERGRHCLTPETGVHLDTHGRSVIVALESERHMDVTVRSIERSDVFYRLTDGEHRLAAVDRRVDFEMLDGGGMTTRVGANGVTLQPDGGFQVWGRHNVTVHDDLLLGRNWGMVLSGLQPGPAFRFDDLPRAPYWSTTALRTSVFKQPLRDPALVPGQLVEVLVTADFGRAVGSEVLRLGPAIVDHGSYRRFFVDRTDIAPSADDVMRLGTVRGVFGTTAIVRPSENCVEDDSDFDYFAGIDDDGNSFGLDGSADLLRGTDDDFETVFCAIGNVTAAFDETDRRGDVELQERYRLVASRTLEIVDGDPYVLLPVAVSESDALKVGDVVEFCHGDLGDGVRLVRVVDELPLDDSSMRCWKCESVDAVPDGKKSRALEDILEASFKAGVLDLDPALWTIVDDDGDTR